MNYSEPLYQQIFVFFKAIGSGIIIGLFYDVAETIQKIISDKRNVVIAKDLLFSFFASVFSFFFMVLYNNGKARLNLLIAQFLGAFVFHVCLGKYLSKPIYKIGLCFKRLLFVLLSPFVKIYKRIAVLFETLLLKIKVCAENKKQKQSNFKKAKKEKNANKTKKCRKTTKKQKKSDIK